MNNYKKIFITLLIVLVGFSVSAQENVQLKGKVMDPFTNAPIEGAIVGSLGSSSVQTDEKGEFVLPVVSLRGMLNIWAPGYFTKEEPILGRAYMEVILVHEDKLGYSESMQVPLEGEVLRDSRVTSSYTLSKNDIGFNVNQAEKALYNIPGLQVIEKGGLPGEGAYLNMRGVSSMLGNTTPLIIINDVPQRLDLNESPVISGFSRGVLNAINPKDIQNITVLRGAEAAYYGSMASNGVILIETDRAVDMDTKIEYFGQFGVNMRNKKMPLLSVNEYKDYVSSVGLTQYSQSQLEDNFPYLKNDPSYVYNYLYDNDTDWQKEIYRVGFLMDHTLKIKGGDAVAKYDMTVGYQGNAGHVEDTKYDKYYVRLNSDVNLHQKLTLSTNLSTAYMVSDLAEQGMSVETNPLLTAFRKAPLFSPYRKDQDGNFSPDYAEIRNSSGSLITNNSVSNPLAVVNDIVAENKAYDIQANAKLRYNINDNITLSGIVGLYYFYNDESLFVPGSTKQTIMPLTRGLAKNTVRVGVTETTNMYYAFNAMYKNTFNHVHDFKASLGVQASTNKSEYDAGEGRNTASDYYRNLGSVPSGTSGGRNFFGYNDEWNWLNFNASAQYIYNRLAGVSLVLASDRSSATGKDADLYGFYPSANGSLYLKNTPWLKNVNAINNFTLRGEFSRTGNSQYPTELSKYYYVGKRFNTVTGIVRSGVPNTKLKPEVNNTWGVGVDLALFNNRLEVRADYYDSKAKDLIMQKQISVAFGTSYMYDNIGEVSNKGYEIGAQYAIIQNRDMSLHVGGTIARNKNKVLSLGGNSDIVTELGDGSMLITQVGQPLNVFYGYQTDGIYQNEQSAQLDGFTNEQARAFKAGDVKFIDQNGDKVINKEDRVVIGDPNPDFFGTIYANYRYKALEVSALFTYSYGNKAYNATRRKLESQSDYGNQYKSVASRWKTSNQDTNMPRAAYGDPMQNSRFSDRFIEDASYLKLKELMVSYQFPVINGLTVYLAGENLFTLTDYLGLDPEFMYSYDSSMLGVDYAKIALARTIKLGVKIKF